MVRRLGGLGAEGEEVVHLQSVRALLGAVAGEGEDHCCELVVLAEEGAGEEEHHHHCVQAEGEAAVVGVE